MRDKRGLPLQVRDQVLDLLARGKYKTGDRIPSEPELIDLLSVSRPTLREGLRILEQERVIRSRQGSGRFLLTNPGKIAVDITQFQSVTELLKERNISATVRLLQVKVIPADKRVAEALRLQPREPVIWIERVRYAEGTPVIYAIDILPAKLAKTEWTPQDFDKSLLEFIGDKWGIYLDHTETTIHAARLDRALARRIRVPRDAAWIMLEQINFSPLGEPIIYSKDYHRGDVITFHVMRYRR